MRALGMLGQDAAATMDSISLLAPIRQQTY
jgi:hypothetical protein